MWLQSLYTSSSYCYYLSSFTLCWECKYLGGSCFRNKSQGSAKISITFSTPFFQFSKSSQSKTGMIFQWLLLFLRQAMQVSSILSHGYLSAIGFSLICYRLSCSMDSIKIPHPSRLPNNSRKNNRMRLITRIYKLIHKLNSKHWLQTR